ncbi:caspase family protein [Hugenholtzia roseola]|uniref:caspase family protein n=1 Tax=Hugenholtzia roseola TaxID=1002 RepID=UPI0012B59CCF|nr:caspase family protein [Hugenholtzia roseola]
MKLIDAEHTQALLIGVSEYQDPALPPLPAAQTNLQKLQTLLASDSIGMAADNIQTLYNETNPQKVFTALSQATQKAKKTLLIYYAGHGVLDDNNELYLTLSSTTVETVLFSGLSIEMMSRIINKERLDVILIIDACFSEKAFEYFKKTNYYVMASSKKNTPSKYPLETLYSAFTNEIVEALEKGINNRKREITLRDLYRHVRESLLSKDFPEPRQINTNIIQEKVFAQNNYDVLLPLAERNRNLIVPIFQAMQHYRPEQFINVQNDVGLDEINDLSRYFEDDSDEDYHDNLALTQKANHIINHYPLSIAEELKLFFAPSPHQLQQTQWRLQQTLKIYEETLRYLAYLLLAQLWDLQMAEKLTLPTPLQSEWKAHLQQIHNPTPAWLFHTIQKVGLIFKSQNVPFFIPELEKWHDKLVGNQDLAHITQDFLSLYEKPLDQILAEKESDYWAALCGQTEQALSRLLQSLAFLTAYELVSVKNILIVKLKNEKPDFLHFLSKVSSESTNLGQISQLPSLFYTDSHSVLLVKDSKRIEPTFLNLSPFIVDKNAYNTKSIPSIFIYEKQENDQAFLYRSLSNRNEASFALASQAGNAKLLKQFLQFLKSF